MAYANKEDQRAYARQHYLDNKDLYKELARKNKRNAQIRNRCFVNRYKVFVGCSKCPYKKFAVALDFHHHSDDKESTVAKLVHDGLSLARIKREIRKCAVLCANCHRELHAGVGELA